MRRLSNRPLRSGRTPTLLVIAHDGMMFTDYDAEPSCTAGRSSFIAGQATPAHRAFQVGMPAATVALQAKDVTIAELLKSLGYATGQFGTVRWTVMDINVTAGIFCARPITQDTVGLPAQQDR